MCSILYSYSTYNDSTVLHTYYTIIISYHLTSSWGTFSSWSKGSSFDNLGKGVPEKKDIVNVLIKYYLWDELLFSWPCFSASSEARRLIPISSNAWTTADQVGVTFFCHSLNIWIRRSTRVEQSALIVSNLGNLIPRRRPKLFQSMTSCSSPSRSRTSGTGSREGKPSANWFSTCCTYNDSIVCLPTVRLTRCEVSFPAELETTHR